MKKIAVVSLIAIMAAASIPAGVAFARHGADDAAGHTRHGEGAGHR